MTFNQKLLGKTDCLMRRPCVPHHSHTLMALYAALMIITYFVYTLDLEKCDEAELVYSFVILSVGSFIS